MSETGTPPITQPVDTHPTRWQVTWATVLAAIPGFLALAPELAQHTLPFIPDEYRQRVLAGASLCAIIAGQLLNRKATFNLANTTLPVTEPLKPVAEMVSNAETTVERVAGVPSAPETTLPPLSDDVAGEEHPGR